MLMKEQFVLNIIKKYQIHICILIDNVHFKLF